MTRGTGAPVGRDWAIRNLGIDEAVGHGQGERARLINDRAIRRELIDFDSESPTARETAGPLARGLSSFVDIDWPSGLTPTPGSRPRGNSLPRCDVLIVTWTVDEGHALSRVLTPGVDSHDSWKPYTKNFADISQHMDSFCPARHYGRLGTYWTTTIGGKHVTLFKSDSHMSQDGPELPNLTVWQQIIADCRPQWVITTGTGGGIGKPFEVGDVVVSRFVAFDCKKSFKRLNGQQFASPADSPSTRYPEADHLFTYNSGFLPPDNSRPIRIAVAKSPHEGILTTDFFGFDNSDNHFGLQGQGDLSEMGDAVLGLACQSLGASAPSYVAVRNVSDPQIQSSGLTLQQQTKMAADIYKAYGRWSSVCSAIVCWAIVAAQ